MKPQPVDVMPLVHVERFVYLLKAKLHGVVCIPFDKKFVSDNSQCGQCAIELRAGHLGVCLFGFFFSCGFVIIKF